MNTTFGMAKIPHIIADIFRKVKKRDDSLRVIIREFGVLESKIRKMAEIDNDLNLKMDELKQICGDVKPQMDAYFANRREHEQYIARRELRECQDLLEEERKLVRQLKQQLAVAELPQDGSVEKAKTLAIFDAIIASISNWSTDGQTAPDIELIFQSILFPLVYEPVCRSNEDYYLQEVPRIAFEIVKRGREYVAHLRQEFPSFINTKESWEKYAPEIQNWVINDALPLIYGARDENWQIKKAYKFASMLVWHDEPHQRIMDFPLVYDGMELVAQRSEDIKSAGIAKFEFDTLSTRIEP